MQIRPICNANSPSNIPWDGHGVMITQKHTMCCLNFGISNDVLGSKLWLWVHLWRIYSLERDWVNCLLASQRIFHMMPHWQARTWYQKYVTLDFAIHLGLACHKSRGLQLQCFSDREKCENLFFERMPCGCSNCRAYHLPSKHNGGYHLFSATPFFIPFHESR